MPGAASITGGGMSTGSTEAVGSDASSECRTGMARPAGAELGQSLAAAPERPSHAVRAPIGASGGGGGGGAGRTSMGWEITAEAANRQPWQAYGAARGTGGRTPTRRAVKQLVTVCGHG